MQIKLNQTNNNRLSKRESGFLLAVIILSFALLYQLDFSGLWYDEIFSHYFVAEGNLESIFFQDPHVFKVHPPLYYGLNYFFHKIFFLKPTEFTLRLIPFASSVIYAVLSYFLVKLLFDSRAAFYSVLLIVSSAFYMYYARESRMYAPNVMFVMASALMMLKTAQEDHWKWKFGYWLFSFLALLTHFSSLFYISWIFLFRYVSAYRSKGRIGWKLALSEFFALGVGVAYFVQKLTSSKTFHDHIDWIPAPSYETFKLFIRNAFFTSTYSLNWDLPFPQDYLGLFGTICVALILVVGILRYKNKRNFTSWFFLFSLGLFPIVGSYIYYLFTGVSAFYPRGFNVTIICFFILLGTCFSFPSKLKKTTTGFWLFICAVLLHHNFYVNSVFLVQKDLGLKKVANTLANQKKPLPIYTQSFFTAYIIQALNRAGASNPVYRYDRSKIKGEFWLLNFWGDRKFLEESSRVPYWKETGRIQTKIDMITARKFKTIEQK